MVDIAHKDILCFKLLKPCNPESRVLHAMRHLTICTQKLDLRFHL